MKFLTTFIGFLPVLCVIQPSFADLRAGGSRVSVASATGRGSVASAADISAAAASRRIPTMISATTLASTAVVGSTTAANSSLMTDTECVDAYTECIRDPEVCGSEFEECTTSELFYAQKPKCNNVLLQCSSAGINTLFGTTSTANLATKNSNGEYVYPTAASVLGQFIEAGAINNRLDTSACVKRYTSCLKKESVCGNDFELCTTNSEFKKQKLFCESTLARCQDEGKTELFGSTNTSSNPTAASRLGILIKEGADLAAVNAVSTCYKVVDQCFLGACSENPYKCIVDSNSIISNITDAINEGRTLTPEQATAIADARTSAQVAAYIRNSCLETIGGNKYCYATFLGNGQMPTAAQLRDEDNRDEVYAEAYSARMNASMREKISQIADKFDKKTKDKCVDTIMSCAMRSCGGGLGSACYQLVFNTGARSDIGGSIAGDNTYQEIKTGCEAIVNTDVNCQYAAASANEQTFNYNYAESGTFGTVFPTSDTGKDPLGVVARLNGALAENYNDAAIERMGKQCRNTAVGCIRSLCGADFVNCYRNRTDVMSDTYDTGNANFDKSMNKLGGVLDFNIVRGLCVNTIKDADTCEEHLKIQMVKNYTGTNGKTGWGNKTSVRDAWVDAVKDGYKQTDSADTRVLMGCVIKKGTSKECDELAGNPNLIEDCGTVDENGCVYSEEYYMTETDYQFTMSVDTLFQEVLGDIEKEAQAKYNAKLTAEQHMCIDANSGGLMGNREMSGTYQWVKLKSKRIPKNYSTAGLKVNDFVASNDLYGSFCRARVTIQSDDPDIQSALQTKNQNWSTAYFAVGDVFTCGSWIPQEQLEKIAKKVACKKAVVAGTLPSGTNCDTDADIENIGLTTGQKWATAAAAIGGAGLGGVGGAYLADSLQSSNMLGGLLQRNRNSNQQNSRNVLAAQNCVQAFKSYNSAFERITEGGVKTETKDGVTTTTYSPAQLKAGEEAIKAMGETVNYASMIVNRQKASSDRAVAAFNNAYDTAKQCVDSTTGIDNPLECLSAMNSLGAQCQNVLTMNGQLADYDNNSRRQAINLGSAVVGATALGITGGLAVANNVKAANRQEFTAAQQEFMNNVGNHIYCFIGADEAGTYGDLIEISVE